MPAPAPPAAIAQSHPARTRRLALLVAFAFTVMADPVSSVAYAIEAALRALGGDLALLLPTMALVVAIIALVTASYHSLVARFPQGGGAAAAAGAAFGEAAAFLPIGALVVDFALTIAISVAAGGSAIVAYLPALAPLRVPLDLVLLAAVAGLTLLGHHGRALFAAMTLAFVAVALAVLTAEFRLPGPAPVAYAGQAGHMGPHALFAVLGAFPVAMALATGVEAPSSAIAQLGQLDDGGRRGFGRATLWLTLGIVGTLTLGLTALAVRLGVGIPPAESTQIAELARATQIDGLFAAFQAVTALLLLAAASSSFQAGPGLLRALARQPTVEGSTGILPGWLGRTNRHHTPYWGVAVYAALAALVVGAAGGRDQVLVLFYAVAVFLSFLVGLMAMARLAHRDHLPFQVAINGAGAVVVGVTLVLNMLRGYPLVSLGAALFIAGGLYAAWVRAGMPRGIAEVVARGEE
jgi:hypothetical protein